MYSLALFGASFTEPGPLRTKSSRAAQALRTGRSWRAACGALTRAFDRAAAISGA